MGVPRDTILTDAPFWIDSQNDVWMALPNGTFVMLAYSFGSVHWVGDEPATLENFRRAGYTLDRPASYAQAMVHILLRVVARFERALNEALHQ